MPPAANQDAANTNHAWEDTGGEHSWESAVQEDADGNIILKEAKSTSDAIRHRRKRLEQNDYAQRNRRVVRDMIRYMYVVVDASRWVRQKDPVLPPGTQLDAIVLVLQEFIQEFYDQNPLSHLGFIIVKNGEAQILTRLSSSSKTHSLALERVTTEQMSEGVNKGGEFSLQNGLEVAGRSLGHQPRHGSREIVIICGALATCDPGQVLAETLPRLQVANIRVSTFALSAELHVCRKVSEETGGSMGVCLDRAHFRDWLIGQCVPPPTLSQESQEVLCEMVQMGFPTRTKTDIPSLVHATRETKILARTAYKCPQCSSNISDLPSDCVVCGLKLVLSPHLARSFHHLFPVAPFVEVPPPRTTDAAKQTEAIVSSHQPGSSLPKIVLNGKLRLADCGEAYSCFSCLQLIGVHARSNQQEKTRQEILRFQCPECKNVFCVDCDSFLHESLHNCPGCLR